MRPAVGILLFLVVLLAGDRLAAHVFGRFIDYSKEPMAALYGGRGEADVLILGNSRAFRHFDAATLAARFNASVANLGYDALPMESAAALLADYIDRYGAPRVVILELSSLSTGPAAIANARTFATRSHRQAELVREHFPEFYFAGTVSHLLNYNSKFALNMAHKVVSARKPQVLNGTEGLGPPAARDYFTPLPANLVALNNILRLAVENQLDLRLVVAPVWQPFGQLNGVREFRALLQSVAAGRRVWYFADDERFPSHLFFDEAHLNSDGVNLFMSFLDRDDFFALPSAAAPPTR